LALPARPPLRPEQARPGIDQGQARLAPLRRNSEKAEEIIGISLFRRLSEKRPGLFHLFYQVRRSGPPLSIELLHHYCEYHIIANLSISWACQQRSGHGTDQIIGHDATVQQNVCVMRSARPEADARPAPVKKNGTSGSLSIDATRCLRYHSETNADWLCAGLRVNPGKGDHL
jgi:hypothetical protein